jgi:zinc transport system substrate-binding protein
MGEGGHDDHDDHSDEGDDHDDEGGEIHADDDEVFNYDPHSWLSPLAFEAQVNVVLEKLMITFPDGNTVFTANAEAYNLQLDALDDSFNAAFGEDGACAGQEKTIVANHNAYSYMSVQYDIEIVSLHGLDPEGEPSPQDIADVVEHINEEGITVLFVEEYTDQTAVDSIVQETGVTIEILYTMEMSPSDANDDYMSMMNKNLDNMVEGIGC